YDLANTIFSINIVSNYFAVWVVDDMGGRDAHFSLATAAATFLMLLTAPLLGALSDQLPRRLPLLAAATATCCALTALLGVGGLAPSLVLFVGANYAFQAGLIVYDALLPVVSTEATRGRVSGLGVGIGYVGSLVGLGIGLAVMAAGGDEPLIFRLTAIAFALFALPCFFWVREPPRPGADWRNARLVRRSVADLRQTIGRLRRYPDLVRFLTGRVFYADAANTLIAYMGIYAVLELGFSDTEKDALLIAGVLAAIVGGLLWGRVVDRIGPKRALSYVLVLWAVTLGLTAAAGLFGLPHALFWPTAALAGLSLGCTWTTDRPFLLRLAPPRHLGQVYGLYAISGRFAAIFGQLLWAFTVDVLGWGRPAAILGLLLMVGISAVVLRPVGDLPRDWGSDERAPT
ncbi:MAG: MFS transporter, partial [Chloroflexota bacterium]|nr:MFS transporter [Chloroflexota bacterium]